MPDPGRLLHTLRQSLSAFKNTPGRRGRVISLEGATDVLVAGDLHGNVENFREILLRAALAKQPQRHLVLQEIIHGPNRYSTGGDKSHQLVDLLAALKCQYPRQVHFLLGNHELSQWTGRQIGKADIDLNNLFYQGVAVAYGERAAEIYDLYLELFACTALAVRTSNRVYLSHSLPHKTKLDRFDPAVLEMEETPPEAVLPGGAVHSLVWGRDTSLSTATAFLQKVDADLLITGHIPSERGFETPNERQLILDSLGYPACYCLFPANRPLSFTELTECVKTL